MIEPEFPYSRLDSLVERAHLVRVILCRGCHDRSSPCLDILQLIDRIEDGIVRQGARLERCEPWMASVERLIEWIEEDITNAVHQARITNR